MNEKMHLSELQTSRAEALALSRELLIKKTGLGGAVVTPPSVLELVDLAEYILSGAHPADSPTVVNAHDDQDDLS